MTIDTQKLREVATNAKELTAEGLIGFRFIAPAHIADLAEVIESCCDHIDAQAAEIARLRWALELSLEYWADRQQCYKSRSPGWVQKVRAALSQEEACQPRPTTNPSPDHGATDTSTGIGRQ